MNLASLLRSRAVIIRFYTWFCVLWFGAGACFMLWCAFCVASGRWRSENPVRDAAFFAIGAVLFPLVAWFCIRVVLPGICRIQDRQLEFIREHGGPRHALKVFLFGEPGDGQSNQS